MESIHENSSALCRPEFSSATKTSFFIKNTRKQPLQQVPGGETPNLFLKRMLELFLKVPSLKKILEFQNQEKDHEICSK